MSHSVHLKPRARRGAFLFESPTRITPPKGKPRRSGARTHPGRKIKMKRTNTNSKSRLF